MRQAGIDQSFNINMFFQDVHTEYEYEDYSCAVFLLNETRCVTLTNSRADEILNNNDGVYLADSTLHFNDCVVMHEYELLLQECANISDHSSIRKRRSLPVKLTSRHLPYQLMVVPVDNNYKQNTIVLIYDPLDVSILRTNLLASAYNLTISEISLCSLFYSGKSMHEICNIMGIKPNTGKTHFRHIFDKCQVSSRIELMRLLSCFNGAWF